MTTFPIPSTLVPICDAITDTLRYALGQGPHQALLTKQTTLVQSMMSAQVQISSSMVNPSPPFNVHHDSADVVFLKKKAEECKEKQKNPLLGEGQTNPYIKIVAALEQSLREGTGNALTKPLRTLLLAVRERRLSGGTRKVIVPKSLGLLSPTPSAGSPMIVRVPSTVPSTISFDVVASSPVLTPSVQSPQAMLTGSPGVVPIQLDATEDDPFAQEVRSTSTLCCYKS